MHHFLLSLQNCKSEKKKKLEGESESTGRNGQRQCNGKNLGDVTQLLIDRMAQPSPGALSSPNLHACTEYSTEYLHGTHETPTTCHSPLASPPSTTTAATTTSTSHPYCVFLNQPTTYRRIPATVFFRDDHHSLSRDLDAVATPSLQAARPRAPVDLLVLFGCGTGEGPNQPQHAVTPTQPKSS